MNITWDIHSKKKWWVSGNFKTQLHWFSAWKQGIKWMTYFLSCDYPSSLYYRNRVFYLKCECFNLLTRMLPGFRSWWIICSSWVAAICYLMENIHGFETSDILKGKIKTIFSAKIQYSYRNKQSSNLWGTVDIRVLGVALDITNYLLKRFVDGNLEWNSYTINGPIP